MKEKMKKKNVYHNEIIPICIVIIIIINVSQIHNSFSLLSRKIRKFKLRTAVIITWKKIK